ncbi:FAD binding domain-containing protein [Fimicolochytrium jonesii]|uniref:FAD binding domain-containing protein n=1 Tax=Fimicolochytrium jonesii TaxID=1396493 RepID=UPI0022FF1307|nr:FAD binding domain-containing protein [Fimicolochytrium jonesii]KAI8818893.1 FAD binding domain-containing protein [Fimicolochytrium jonesii]
MKGDKKELDVLIVGAGPVGLFVALSLKRMGVAVRIIDKATEPAKHSRAFVLHVRTQEVLGELNLLSRFKDEGWPLTHGHFIANGKLIGSMQTAVPENDPTEERTYSRGPLAIPQSFTENILTQELAKKGVTVERGISLIEFKIDQDAKSRPNDHVVQVTLSDGSTARCRYLIGADGGHSAVRRLMGVKLEGRSLPGVVGMVDGLVKTSAPIAIDGMTLVASTLGSALMIPHGKGYTRCIVDFTSENRGLKELSETESPSTPATTSCTAAPTYHTITDAAPDMPLEPIVSRIRRLLHPHDFDITDVEWLVKLQFQERMAKAVDVEQRVFIIGDAAHVHSPAGGLGLNTGIQDAHGLAWRIALALKHNGNRDSLFSTYGIERMSVAQQVLGLSGRLHASILGGAGLWQLLVKRIVAIIFNIFPSLPKRMRRMGGGLLIAYSPNALIQASPAATSYCTLRPGSRAPNGLIEKLSKGILSSSVTTESALFIHDTFPNDHFTVLVFYNAQFAVSTRADDDKTANFTATEDRKGSPGVCGVEISLPNLCTPKTTSGTTLQSQPTPRPIQTFLLLPRRPPRGFNITTTSSTTPRRPPFNAIYAAQPTSPASGLSVFEAYGVKGDAVVVVRPDGYVGCVARMGDWRRVEGYFDGVFGGAM